MFLKKVTAGAVISFVIVFALCASIISFSVTNKMNVERLTMEQLISEKSMKANEALFRLLYKTHTLAALVLQENDEIRDFDKIAATLIDDPAILNVIAAPDGVVSKVYPRQGNEEVIGFDFFSEGAGNKEALLAKESGQLVFGGPFESVQGGLVLVGRLPVFVNSPGGEERFWGLVSITLKYPQVLDCAGLNELHLQGFAYEIWRINPDSGEQQIIAESPHASAKNARYMEKTITIQNAEWVFRILPVRAWYEYPDTWLLVFLGFCISLLVACVVQNNKRLKLLKASLERMSYTDPLTGIYNRRYFMGAAAAHLSREENTDSFVVLFDLDHFKRANDTYGHLIGDEVLQGVARRVQSAIRPYDLFARYGGEEFIILVTGIDTLGIRNMIERVRLDIMENPIEFGDTAIQITASFGISFTSPGEDLTEAIDRADKALYAAKNEGRNRIVFYERDSEI